LTTQHELLVGYLQNSKKPKTLDEIQKFIERIRPIPRSTIRARLTELNKTGVIEQNDEGWVISDTNGVPTITPTKYPQECEQRVAEVGAEIEGGWNGEEAPEGMYGDVSVKCAGDHIGEIASRGSLEEMLEWVGDNYPDEMDRSCGIHVHVSFTNRLAYMQLMSRTFYYKWFLPRVEKWAEELNINKGSAFYVRFEGKKGVEHAKFSMKGFHAEKQSKMLGKDGLRYYHLNYCYKLHTTIECRLFPTFQKKELAVKAIEFYVNLCNEFLAQCKPEKTHHAVVKDDDTEVRSFDI